MNALDHTSVVAHADSLELQAAFGHLYGADDPALCHAEMEESSYVEPDPSPWDSDPHEDTDDDHYEDHDWDDVEADADALASAGMGTDEDYGYYGGEDSYLDSSYEDRFDLGDF